MIPLTASQIAYRPQKDTCESLFVTHESLVGQKTAHWPVAGKKYSHAFLNKLKTTLQKWYMLKCCSHGVVSHVKFESFLIALPEFSIIVHFQTLLPNLVAHSVPQFWPVTQTNFAYSYNKVLCRDWYEYGCAVSYTQLTACDEDSLLVTPVSVPLFLTPRVPDSHQIHLFSLTLYLLNKS